MYHLGRVLVLVALVCGGCPDNTDPTQTPTQDSQVPYTRFAPGVYSGQAEAVMLAEELGARLPDKPLSFTASAQIDELGRLVGPDGQPLAAGVVFERASGDYTLHCRVTSIVYSPDAVVVYGEFTVDNGTLANYGEGTYSETFERFADGSVRFETHYRGAADEALGHTENFWINGDCLLRP